MAGAWLLATSTLVACLGIANTVSLGIAKETQSHYTQPGWREVSRATFHTHWRLCWLEVAPGDTQESRGHQALRTDPEAAPAWKPPEPTHSVPQPRGACRAGLQHRTVGRGLSACWEVGLAGAVLGSLWNRPSVQWLMGENQ